MEIPLLSYNLSNPKKAIATKTSRNRFYILKSFTLNFLFYNQLKTEPNQYLLKGVLTILQ